MSDPKSKISGTDTNFRLFGNWLSVPEILSALLLSFGSAATVRAETPAESFAAAEVLLHKGVYEEALAGYRDFVSRFPDDWRAAQARFTAAFILQKKLKRPEQAREAYETVIQCNATSPLARHAQYHIAEAYEQGGETQKAIREYRQFLKKAARHARVAGVKNKLEFLDRLSQGQPDAERPGWAYRIERKQWRKSQLPPLEPGEKRQRKGLNK
jgi:tetratricopeptide (TPR) repeat protein